jgi:hypothetical protein
VEPTASTRALRPAFSNALVGMRRHETPQFGDAAMDLILVVVVVLQIGLMAALVFYVITSV